jgi:hypothetical protein
MSETRSPAGRSSWSVQDRFTLSEGAGSLNYIVAETNGG